MWRRKDFWFSFAIIAGTLFSLAARISAREPLELKSPDGKISVTFELKESPYLPGVRATYRVAYEGKEILADSPLGLDFKDSSALDRDFELVGENRESHDSTWENPFGARRNVRDHFNQLKISLCERQAPRREMDLIFRAYDEGIAFRYFLPAQEALHDFTLSSENTGFYFARDASAFALDLSSFTTPYESEYRRINLSQIKPTSITPLPLVVEMPGGPWVALLEADLTDYAGMYVGGVPGFENALESRLSPLPERSDEAVKASTPKATPWRILMISPTPGGLIESSDLELNLSAPSALADVSWIKPGKAAWDWWSGSYASGVNFKPGMNTATMEHYVDFSAAHHLDYMLIDAGWFPQQDDTHPVDILHHTKETDVPTIVEYAKPKGVKILLWVHWSALDKHLDEALNLYNRWGVAGIKVDYMNRDDQEMVNFYERVVKKAAEHHLVVDFHGAFKPTGLRRAYPNLLVREGVMGMEYSKWSARVTPEYDTTIPFTRMLTGPMDYTPGCFNNATKSQFQPRFIQPMCQGTRAHQLAMYVDFLAPLVMLSDFPENYDNNPGMEFLEKVPTVWDDTKVLAGEPGKFVAIARKHGDTWYLGAMTN
ncbi:MAG TPA: glycoside hydrolase family 97 protein, partial [Terriglobia bacterium]|nr:glycoside hydrolase family 97 protein [Terriglobia bacterium]